MSSRTNLWGRELSSLSEAWAGRGFGSEGAIAGSNERLRHESLSSAGEGRNGSLRREAEDGRFRPGEERRTAAQGADSESFRLQCREVGGNLFVVHREFLQSRNFIIEFEFSLFIIAVFYHLLNNQ